MREQTSGDTYDASSGAIGLLATQRGPTDVRSPTGSSVPTAPFSSDLVLTVLTPRPKSAPARSKSVPVTYPALPAAPSPTLGPSPAHAPIPAPVTAPAPAPVTLSVTATAPAFAPEPATATDPAPKPAPAAEAADEGQERLL